MGVERPKRRCAALRPSALVAPLGVTRAATLAVLVGVLATRAAAEAPTIQPPLVNDWLPSNWWTPVQSVSGRLNEDVFDDLAVVVERRTDAPEDPDYPRGSRGLFVLFGMLDGGWRRGTLAPGLLPCSNCISTLGGTLGSAIFDLVIPVDGQLEVGWVEGGRFTKAVRLFIGWDTTEQGFGLSADEIHVLRPRTGSSRIRRDYRAGRVWVDGVEQQMPARFIPIEDVSAGQY